MPFLKWAGGKRWLASDLIKKIGQPKGRYIEPFLGGGAVFFALQPRKALLGDLNTELIETYKVIQSDWYGVQEKLEHHQKSHSKDYYYFTRSIIPNNPLDRAARFIYLNRTCWNGLYRVNLSGVFNVPIGTKNTVLLDTDDFQTISHLLQPAIIVSGDFEALINQAVKGDTIFADPPYTVRHKFNGFIKYNESLFSWQDQLRLRDACLKAIERGVKVFITNADHESIRKIYQDNFELNAIERYSSISGKSSARGKFSELIITG